MATRDELTTYVLERLGVGSSRAPFVSIVEGTLEREYHRVVRRFRLSHDEADLALTADDHYVELPDDFMAVRTLRIGTRTLREVSMDDLSRAAGVRELSDAGSEVSGPRNFVFMGDDRIYVDPAPAEDDDTGAKLFYVPRPPAWTTGSDTPSLLPSEYHDLIAERTIWRMALNQEEFATHASAAAGIVAALEQELEYELTIRNGDPEARVIRRVYG